MQTRARRQYRKQNSQQRKQEDAAAAAALVTPTRCSASYTVHADLSAMHKLGSYSLAAFLSICPVSYINRHSILHTTTAQSERTTSYLASVHELFISTAWGFNAHMPSSRRMGGVLSDVRL